MKTKQELIDYVYNENGRARPIRFQRESLEKNGFGQLLDKIHQECIDVGLDGLTLTDEIRAYCKNQMFDPHCSMCGIRYRFWSPKHQAWSKYCSQKCVQNDPIVLAKNFVEDHAELMRKAKKTNLERYGVEYQSQRQERKDALGRRTKEIWNDPAKKLEFIEQRNKTTIERYGDNHPSKHPDAIQKGLKVRKENAALRSDEEKQAAEQQRLERYRKARISPECYALLEDYDFMYDLCIVQNLPVEDCAEIIGCSPSAVLTSWKEHGIVYEPKFHHQESAAEIEMYEFIRSLESTAIRTFKLGKHLDVYIPERKLGFEYNGIYWHSTPKKDMNYHRDKVNHFYEHGIRYVQIWEDDWKARKDWCKDLIRDVLLENEHSSSINFHCISDGIYELVGDVRSKDFPKILNDFIMVNQPEMIYATGDLEIIDKRNNVYLDLGFVDIGFIEPIPKYYTNSSKRREIVRPIDGKTTVCYNSGTIRYLWTNKKPG